MRSLIFSVMLVLAPMTLASTDTLPAGAAFQVLAYHDVRDSVREDYDDDQYAISTANLIDHFTWLRQNGFNVVSADAILAAATGGPELPENAVLLTFDDGLKSVVTHVLPLLELFDYPAVVSIVTDWIETDAKVVYASQELSGSDFLSWEDVTNLARHELIEIASHSHDLHRGIHGNPQGNEQPAGVTLAYGASGYETDEQFVRRIRQDLATSADLIEQATGRRPRVMTWPYGAHNASTVQAAHELGMPMTLTLSDGIGNVNDLVGVPRHLVEANPGFDQLSWSLLHRQKVGKIRAAHVDLDYVYDPDPAQQEANIGRLLDRILALKISHVFLQAFADPDADGAAQSVYFPNRYLPMRADLFNRVAWQLKTRADVAVYAWMPILGFEGAGIDPEWRVSQLIDGVSGFDAHAEPRLSPFSAEARAVINGIYGDLARHANFDGILFHDDGRFNEFEDFSPAARAVYQRELGGAITPARLADDPALAAAWGELRTDAIIGLTEELAATVRHYRPAIRTVRNMFATALLESEPGVRLAQDYERFLRAYDYVAIMAMPRFEGYRNHQRFYRRLADAARLPADQNNRVIFELQTVDWRTGEKIDSAEIRDTLLELQALGIASLAYYPDDFISGHPQVGDLRAGMSIALFPAEVSP